MTTVPNSASYVAGKVDEFYYPELGDPVPPGGAQVNLLTKGGQCIRGQWPANNKNGFYLGWAPFPKRNRAREQELQALRATLGR